MLVPFYLRCLFSDANHQYVTTQNRHDSSVIYLSDFVHITFYIGYQLITVSFVSI